MRIHTDVHNLATIIQAVHSLPGVTVTAAQQGSRSHARAFEVHLKGNDTATGATWDEWGIFIAALYEVDPDALWGSQKHPVYRDASDFHDQTNDRFSDPQAGLPADTHKRHIWHADYPRTPLGQWACQMCSAVRRVA